MDNGLIIIYAALIFMGLLLYLFEKSKLSSKEISLIAVLASIAALSRVAFSIVPSVQPTTFIIIISGFVFGPLSGFLVGIFATLVSNIFLGHGPWTVFQMLAWGLCGLSSGYLGRIHPNSGRIYLSVFALIWGFLFGWINNIWHWLAFIQPQNLKSLLAVNLTSIHFDVARALFNFIFMYFIGSDFIKILKRFSLKLKASYKKEN